MKTRPTRRNTAKPAYNPHETPEKDRVISQFFKRLWQNTPIATVVLVVSLAVAGLFTVRSVALWVYWHDPQHRAQAIEPWMTPKYIAHSWAVPPHIVGDALGDFQRHKKGPMNLDQIAAAKDMSTRDLITSIEDAIHSFNLTRPSPPPPPPPHRPAPKDGS
ncbi:MULTISPECIES: hypothetical protein [Pacificibacter]|uniref:hypothetical protein n=1 Tax=Pacificibacter TaxID=1042323 RepID=UPI001C08E3BA|nr:MULTISPECIES: hypothetical protein [Pacificibacter]MBU2936258.1 hypothetical protein [Pacificibacter marinus]MDO6616727.1 hypothetical protein [Pacificibacter sp. 1_MG-2023]